MNSCVSCSGRAPFSPAISKSLEPVTSQLSSTVAAKLSAVEATLKENLIKVVKSKVCVFENCQNTFHAS